jgi:hypothetical protein
MPFPHRSASRPPIRCRIRAIIVRQKKRSRFLLRHLKAAAERQQQAAPAQAVAAAPATPASAVEPGEAELARGGW